MAADPKDAPRFAVLIVCTANLCRSPIAEHLLSRTLDDLGVDWSVSSAGTRTRGGEPMSEPAARLLGDHGIGVSTWRSTALDGAAIDRADLVLTAESAHRSHVVTLRPNALARTFPLRQFARLAAHVAPLADPRGAKAGPLLLKSVLAVRAHVQPAAPGAEDIADPIGRRMRAYRACFDTIAAAVAELVGPLGPPPAAAG